ncbi:GNAT family N-acetyltransferase [Exiguobacterium sp.]|uniref:GNAT family N-acetyltransferase n=1 Tax=Exiguobacterium sp. TaxID=44751 RepID=UPI00263ACFB6|nr:GNAT family N-acetyltransferase [Exiguobacterium sp.]MCC5892528.1 GNAT family N-acetyltransferase [Exiguobacterium sp.]
MEFKVWGDPYAFAERVLPELMKREAEHSLMIGVLDDIKQGKYDDFTQVTIEANGRLLASLQVTPPHPLNYVLFDEQAADDVMRFLIPVLLESELIFDDVVSERTQAMNFYALWTHFTGNEPKIFMEQGFYRLERVNDVALAEGRIRQATPAERPLLEQWYNAFAHENGLDRSDKDKVSRVVQAMVDNGDAYVWEVDGKTVSCAKKSRPTENGVTVSFVYTVPERRGNGYGRSIVAELSRELLKTKRFCTLYTDLTNPTSNKIYQEVGYEPIMESSWIRLAR